jgi:predicted DNA-binding transcriptional regulator AlpA
MSANNSVTLDEIRRSWPPTIDVVTAGNAFGLGRAASYDLVRRGEFPCQVLRLGHRLRVVTADVIRVLSGNPSG